jgi:nucleoid-associated protein YejK
MTLERLIIHRIIRDPAAAGGFELVISNRQVELDAKATNFVSELHNRYRGIRQSNGNFRTTGNPFFTQFQEYHVHTQDNIFIEFTSGTLPGLQTAMTGTAAKGGYLVFADYTVDASRYVGIFLIRNRQGSRLEHESRATTFRINETEHVDFEHLAMACRIHMGRYAGGVEPYLTFINTRGADSEFFKTWVGVGPLVDSTEYTQNLLKILKALPPPLGHNKQHKEPTAFLNEVYTHIKNGPRGVEVDLQEIGRIFYQDENALTDYAEQHGLVLDYVFKPDNAVLRKFVNIKVKVDGFDLNFPQIFLDEHKVVLQPREGRIVINSPELVKAIESEFRITNG